MKTVLITGVNGFLGSHLATALAVRGWRVRGTTRSAAGLAVAIEGVAEKAVLDLGRPVERRIFAGIDAVIHCAYDLRRAAMEQNVAATKAIAEAAAAAGARQQLFIGSYSGHGDAARGYGRTKYLLQEYFLARRWTVARPGLVIGTGGLYARLVAALRFPIVPLPDGGRDLVPVIAVKDFVAAVSALLDGRRAGVFNLYHPDLIALRDLIAAIRTSSGRRAFLAPLPSPFLIALARAAGALGVSLPFDAKNFLALRTNQNCVETSDLLKFVAAPLRLDAMVDAARRSGVAGELSYAVSNGSKEQRG
jgi:nucleoside-diphosphate-sugar epimerase